MRLDDLEYNAESFLMICVYMVLATGCLCLSAVILVSFFEWLFWVI